MAACPGRGEVLPDHVELVGDESGTVGTLDMMNDEPGQPATARGLVCQAVQCAMWRASVGADTP